MATSRARPALTVQASDAARWRALRSRAVLESRLSAGLPLEPEGQPRPWFKLTNQDDGDRAVIDIYAEIGYWGVSAADFIDQLRAVSSSTIELHINSPGGDVYDGIAIYSALVDHPATVDVYVDALAASAASFIAQAGDKVTMGRNAEMMIHDAWGYCVGNAADMLTMTGLLNKASDNIASIYAARAGNGGTKTWRARMEGETWYSASETVDVGLADAVAKTEPRRGTADQPEDRHDRRLFAYGSRAEAPTPDVPTVDPPAPAPAADPPEGDPFVIPDDVVWPDPKALHLAFLDAADAAGLGVDTTPLREELEGDWDYDPDVFRATLLDLAEHVPVPEPAPVPEPPIRFFDIDSISDTLREALAP